MDVGPRDAGTPIRREQADIFHHRRPGCSSEIPKRRDPAKHRSGPRRGLHELNPMLHDCVIWHTIALMNVGFRTPRRRNLQDDSEKHVCASATKNTITGMPETCGLRSARTTPSRGGPSRANCCGVCHAARQPRAHAPTAPPSQRPAEVGSSQFSGDGLGSNRRRQQHLQPQRHGRVPQHQHISKRVRACMRDIRSLGTCVHKIKCCSWSAAPR